MNLREQDVHLWPKLVLQSLSNDSFPFIQREACLLAQIPTANAANASVPPSH